MDEIAPTTIEEASGTLRSLSSDSVPVRFLGGGTKSHWGGAAPEPDVVVRTTSLAGVVEHNAGDLTAVVLAGTPLIDAQKAFGAAGQMLAIDPPESTRATIGGAIATADSGPMRYRYGAPRDLVLGITAVMSDGAVARSGGKVIKNVAGYDLGKLFCGAWGTLGMIARVALRLHPRPPAMVTAVGRSEDPFAIQAAAGELAHGGLEPMAIDVAWSGGVGRVLARFGGAAAGGQARRAADVLSAVRTDVDIVDADEELWSRQRAGQRSETGVVVRLSVLPTEIAEVLRCADAAAGSVAGRAVGLVWVTLPPAAPLDAVAAVEELRSALAPRVCTVLDAPIEVRAKLDVWGAELDGRMDLMRRLKQQFDPAGICNPGIFMGGI